MNTIFAEISNYWPKSGNQRKLAVSLQPFRNTIRGWPVLTARTVGL